MKQWKATGDLIVNKIADRLLLQNNSETLTNEHDKEIPQERYISSKEKQKIIDDLILIK